MGTSVKRVCMATGDSPNCWYGLSDSADLCGCEACEHHELRTMWLNDRTSVKRVCMATGDSPNCWYGLSDSADLCGCEACEHHKLRTMWLNDRTSVKHVCMATGDGPNCWYGLTVSFLSILASNVQQNVCTYLATVSMEMVQER